MTEIKEVYHHNKTFWKKKTAGGAFKNEIMKKKELPEELQK